MENNTGHHNYSEFLKKNRTKINTYMNRVLWICSFTGPAIGLGIYAGIFKEVSYSTCISISVSMLFLSALHLVMLKFLPGSEATSIFALFIMDILLIYMSYSFIDIHITWFIAPMLSIMFCSRRVFITVAFINYFMMLASSWIMSPYNVTLRSNYSNSTFYFLNEAGGYTIEYIVMTIAAFALGRTAISYYHELISNNRTIHDHEVQLKDQMEVLNSMAEIYDYVCLIDYDHMTAYSISDGKALDDKLDFKVSSHSKMDKEYLQHVAPDHTEKFMDFTNLTTVRERLEGNKSISFEYVNMLDGWMISQFISIESPDGKPTNMVVYTAQNIDSEKRKEETLLRISLTDELTGLNNRRSYYRDVADIKENGIDEDLVLFSIDINELKPINDHFGHAAGDELIKGAAKTLSSVLGTMGKVYRTGGDEFLAIVHTTQPEMIKKATIQQSVAWHGRRVSKLSFSIGYAAACDHPDASITDLEKIADNLMYDSKELYYKNKGIDRRRSGHDSRFNKAISPQT